MKRSKYTRFRLEKQGIDSQQVLIPCLFSVFLVCFNAHRIFFIVIESFLIAYIISALIGYFVGSFPTAYLLVKWKTKVDIRQVGSGNVGTLNTMEVTGSKSLGVAVLIIDILKGAVPVLLTMPLFGSSFALLVTAGFGAIIGHSFPVWLHFKGGRGLATSAGVLLVIGWIYVVLWLVLWLFIYVPTRSIHAGNVIASMCIPLIIAAIPTSVLSQALPPYTSTVNLLHFSIAFCVLVIVTHREPILQLIKGKQVQ